jgi:hypothetical protein
LRLGGPLFVFGFVSVFELGLFAVPAGASGGDGAWHPVVVQRLVRAFLDQGDQGVLGPRTLSVHLAQPSLKGDLLVAAVDDGVVTSGMVHPRYLFDHWELGATTIGGETANDGQGGYKTGGLQASIYFFPDNPGGIRTIEVASIPKGTQDFLTVTIAELSGVPADLSVDVTGTSTSGRTAAMYTQKSAVSTSAPTSARPDLVVALFNNGGNAPDGEHYVTRPGWTLIGEDTAPNNADQPILADFKVTETLGVVSQTERYLGGYPIDNCAVIVALK